MEQELNESRRVDKWAREHKDLWDIVSGIRCTSIEHNRTVCRLLHEAGLYELSEMMALRIYQLMIDGETVI